MAGFMQLLFLQMVSFWLQVVKIKPFAYGILRIIGCNTLCLVTWLVCAVFHFHRDKETSTLLVDSPEYVTVDKVLKHFLAAGSQFGFTVLERVVLQFPQRYLRFLDTSSDA